MQACHTIKPIFDDPNLVAFGGLPAVMRLAEHSWPHGTTGQRGPTTLRAQSPRGPKPEIKQLPAPGRGIEAQRPPASCTLTNVDLQWTWVSRPVAVQRVLRHAVVPDRRRCCGARERHRADKPEPDPFVRLGPELLTPGLRVNRVGNTCNPTGP